MSLTFVERDQNGQRIHTSHIDGFKKVTVHNALGTVSHRRILASLAKVFLPTGYPDTASEDYMRYQILNCLQAFCSSVANLISSRAVLEGVGVGDASASATNALLLTTLQDVFSRLTTIVSASYLGSALTPEAKRYRLLADVFNNLAIVIDILVPLLKRNSNIPGIHVMALCLSGSLRALCGIVAGGSKTAITAHFASPINGKGDMGDLSAKDASKETVLSLIGLLLGTFIVPYLTTRSSTFTAILVLLTTHLLLNYYAVRGLTLRTLNQQRTSLAWIAFRRQGIAPQSGTGLAPDSIAKAERIFQRSGVIRDISSNSVTPRSIIGRCSVGSSISSVIGKHPIPSRIIRLLEAEHYLVWFDPSTVAGARSSEPSLHIFFKEGYTEGDTLKAWTHAVDICLSDDAHGLEDKVEQAYKLVNDKFSAFQDGLKEAGWNLDEILTLSGPPMSLVVEIGDEGKKNS